MNRHSIHVDTFDSVDKELISKGSFRFVRPSKFRHIFGETPKKDQCYEFISQISRVSPEGSICAVNQKFLAIALESTGGAFSIIPIEKVSMFIYVLTGTRIILDESVTLTIIDSLNNFKGLRWSTNFYFYLFN